jgi:hypothetical protein
MAMIACTPATERVSWIQPGNRECSSSITRTFVVCRRYWRNNLKTVQRLATQHGAECLDTIHFVFAGGEVRSFLSLVSYLGTGENRGRYLGVKIPPSNLQPGYDDAARTFAGRLTDRLAAGNLAP